MLTTREFGEARVAESAGRKNEHRLLTSLMFCLAVARIVDCERNGCCGQTWQQLVSTATEDEDRVVNVHHACVEDGVAFCTEWPWQQEYQRWP